MLAAVRRLVLTKGLDVTMDELAECSGASRRTLFRHFTTRDKLLAAAFEAGIVDYRQQLPAYDGDRDSWLRATCDTAHRMNATIGPGFFNSPPAEISHLIWRRWQPNACENFALR